MSTLATMLVMVPIGAQLLLIVRQYVNWMPVWAWYPDPGYQYLLLGGGIITGSTPKLVEHPGTAMQWTIGVAEYLTHVVAGEGEFRSDILQRPEFYAQAAGGVLASLYLLALALAVWRFVRAFGVWPALVFQLLLLWGLPILSIGRYRLWPESLVLTCGIVALALLAPTLARQRQPSSAETLVLGLISAIGITTKVIYLPLFLIPLLLLGRQRIVLYLGAATLSISLIFIPIYSRLGYMVDWYRAIGSSPGRHGQSGDWHPLGGLYESITALGGFVRWLTPVALVILIGSFIVTVTERDRISSYRWRPAASLVVSAVLVILPGVKQTEPRDFILLIPLMGTLAALTLADALRLHTRKTASQAIIVTAVGTSAFLGAHGVVGNEYFMMANRQQVEKVVVDSQAVERHAAKGHWALGYNVWTVDNALMFSIPWIPGAYESRMWAQAPQALYFDLWTRTINAVTPDGLSGPVACSTLANWASNGNLGIVVESQGHLVLDDSRQRILLRDGSATYDTPTPLGPYHSYRLTSVSCQAT